MANITVVKSGNSVRINFNDYGSNANINAKYRSFDIRDIVEIEMPYDESHIHVVMRDSHEVRQWDITWDTTYSGDEYFIIDSVDGVSPTSESDLFDKLEALR